MPYPGQLTEAELAASAAIIAEFEAAAKERRARDAERIAAAKRFHAMIDRTPERRAVDEAADQAEMDRVHAEWLASGEPDWFEEFQAKRSADRAAAMAEWQAIDLTLLRVRVAADSTDEQVATAEAQHAAAFAEWHKKYDHLWTASELKKAGEMLAAEQATYAEQMRIAAMTVVPFQRLPADVPVPAGPTQSGNMILPRGHIEFIPGDSDEAMTTQFVEQYAGTIRYVAVWNKWLEWDGQRWKQDDTLRAYDLARGVIRAVANVIDPRSASKLASAGRVSAVEKMAKSDRKIAATADQWDSNPWLLNTPGGIIDLKTGQMRATQPDDYVTKMAAVAPGGDCPTWLAFLHRITAGDTELIAFMQRALGYALTGVTREHVLFFGHGTGANGKGVLLNTVSGILGDYHRTAAVEVFTASNQDRHPTDVAGLRGARLVTATETEQGRRWAEAKIKELTGGDKITARLMRQDYFDFIPTFKLFITGNHKPRIQSVDEAVRRRIHLLPFTVTIPPAERDHTLTDRLKAEWPGILEWMVEGCLQWQKSGLQPPQAVLDATANYLTAEDALGSWLDERCERDPEAFTTREDLWRSWSTWAIIAAEQAGSSRGFKDALEARGFENAKRNGRWGCRGIRIKSLMPPPPV